MPSQNVEGISVEHSLKVPAPLFFSKLWFHLWCSTDDDDDGDDDDDEGNCLQTW